MCNRFKKLVVTFLTIFIAGSVFLPSISFAQTGDTATVTQPNPTNQVLTQTGSGFQESLPNLPICSVIGEGDGTFEGCFVRLFYYAILYPSAWIASIAGQVFDYFVAYTLNSESYHSGGFIESGWRIVRDFVNASFIFILLYVAIRFIINAKSSGMERIVSRIIILAIVINFSLFMTRAIIDAGNILARVFYEKIVVENDIGAETTNYTTLSAGLIGKVNPQKLLSPDTFRIRHQATGVDSSIEQNTLGTLNNVDNEALGDGFQVGAGFMILIILLASVVNIALAWVFFSVSLSLVGRTLGLWIMMIMSPVAFASASIPFIKVPKYGFNDWLKKTAELSFMAVLFMFFLYLTIMFLDIANSTILNVAFQSENMSTVHLIMSVIVPCMAVLYLLKIAQNQAKSMSGEFGSMVGTALKWGTTAVLGAGGLALGATAALGGVAGRQIGGRFGAKMAAGADTTKWSGRMQKRMGNYMSKATYDARNMKIPKPIGKIAGLGRSGLSYATDGAVSAGDFKLSNLGSGSTRNYSKLREDRIKKVVDEAKEFAPTEGSSVDVNGTQVSVSEAQKILDRKRIDAKQANDYDDKIKNRDKRKKVLDETKQDYNTSLREFSQGKITDIELASVKRALDDTKKYHDAAIKEVKDIETLWATEEKQFNDAKKALAKKKTEFFKNYSKTVDDWAEFPDIGLTHRYGANKEAADEIENLGIKEEKKEEKK